MAFIIRHFGDIIINMSNGKKLETLQVRIASSIFHSISEIFPVVSTLRFFIFSSTEIVLIFGTKMILKQVWHNGVFRYWNQRRNEVNI